MLNCRPYSMDKNAANSICSEFPAVTFDSPFGTHLNVWKVGGKIFAVIPEDNSGVTLKLASEDEAYHLIELEVVQRAPYFTRGGWVWIAWEDLPDAEIARRLRESYDKVCSLLPKALRPELPE